MRGAALGGNPLEAPTMVTSTGLALSKSIINSAPSQLRPVQLTVNFPDESALPIGLTLPTKPAERM